MAIGVKELFEKGAFVDIETLGLDVGSPIHQVSYYSASDRKAIEFIPRPYELVGPPSSDPLRKTIDRAVAYKDWPSAVRDFLSRPKSSWLARKIKENIGTEPLYPHLLGQQVGPRVAQVGRLNIPVTTIEGLDPGEVLKQLFSNIKEDVVFIANPAFESVQLGAVGKVFGITEQIRSQLTHAPRYANELLYVSDPGILAARVEARATEDWTKVFEAIENIDLTRSGKKVIDVQDIIRASQSYGQLVSKKLGLGIDLKDVSTGVGLDVQSRIMGIGPEFHRATEDNLLSAIIGRRSSQHIEAYRSMLTRASSVTGGALRVSNAAEADALNWAHRMHQFKAQSSSIYMKYNIIARAMRDINEQGYTTITSGWETRSIPQISGGQFTRATIPVSKRQAFMNLDELFNYLRSASKDHGLDLNNLSKEVMKESRYNPAALSALIESEVEKQVNSLLPSIEKQTRFKIGDVIGGGKTISPTKLSSAKMGGKLGYTIAGLGLLGIGIGGVKGLFSPVDNDNSFDGMTEDNYASYLRQYNTDFGSPYQGLWGSTSQYILSGGMQQIPIYINNVPIDQQIANFRDQQMQTPLQEQLIEAEWQRQQLKSISRLYFLDPALTAPLANNNWGISNVNTYGGSVAKSKNLQILDITHKNWAVEDADTIILREGVKGLMGSEIQVRLAGIDAPEIEHTDEEVTALRYKQSQPHGYESKEALERMLNGAKSIQLVLDPAGDTYGRSLGAIIADGKNINLELVREGHAAALPFGDETSDLISRNILLSHEQMSYENNRGMWADDYWRSYRQAVNNRNRITFNTLTRLDKLASNMNLAALQSTMELSGEPGYGPMVAQSLPYLRSKLSTIGTQRSYSEFFVPVKYQSQQEHLDQLKIETSRHMNVHGNLLADNRMKVSGHQIGNIDFAVDSLERSPSIYQSKLPAILDKYEKKVSKRRIQGASHRQAINDLMNNQSNYMSMG